MNRRTAEPQNHEPRTENQELATADRRWSLVVGRWSLVTARQLPAVVAMRITSLEDLRVYQRACRAADAISAILDRPILLKFADLRKDLAETSARIPPNVAEGFGRGTDKDCAHFQHIARGSANEMCAHLRTALSRDCISKT